MAIGTVTIKKTGVEMDAINLDYDDDGELYYVLKDGTIVFGYECIFEPLIDEQEPLPEQDGGWDILDTFTQDQKDVVK